MDLPLPGIPVPGERRGTMARINSRRKGKNGELQVAHLFQAAGYKAERGCQHDGLSGHADVIGVPPYLDRG